MLEIISFNVPGVDIYRSLNRATLQEHTLRANLHSKKKKDFFSQISLLTEIQGNYCLSAKYPQFLFYLYIFPQLIKIF